MRKCIYLFFLLAVLISCEQKKQQDSNAYNETIVAKSVLISAKEKTYEIKLYELNENSRGKADGSNMIQRSGPLHHILSEIYKAPVILDSKLYIRNNYKLDVTWDTSTSFSKIQGDIIDLLKEEFNFSVIPVQRLSEVNRLYICDESLLEDAKSSDKFMIRTKSKVSIVNDTLSFFGTLDDFIISFSDYVGEKMIFNENYKNQLFHIELLPSELHPLDQLEQTYGICSNKIQVDEEYYKIMFN